jgi:hypothetical protein
MNWPADNGGHTKITGSSKRGRNSPLPTKGEYKEVNLKHSEHYAEINEATYVLAGKDSG